MAEQVYKYRFLTKVVAIMDLTITLLSIYLLVIFFALALTLTSCLFNPRDDCISNSGNFGLGKFSIGSSSSSSTSYTRVSNSNGNFDEHPDNFDSSMWPSGFDMGRNRNSQRDKKEHFETFPYDKNKVPQIEYSGNQWLLDGERGGVFQGPRTSFLKIDTGDEKKDEEISGLMKIFYVIVAVVIWTLFATAVAMEIIMLIAAVKLLISTNKGKTPTDAVRSANCWRVCTVIMLVLFVLNLLGGHNNMEGVVLGVVNVLFRVSAVFIVSLYISELENAQEMPTGTGQVYYDINATDPGDGGHGHSHSHGHPGDFSNPNQCQSEMGWSNAPKCV